MKVSTKWLKTMVEVPADLKAFAERLDLTGTAVDSVTTTGEDFANIVVGHILAREHHPNADTLWVTSVDVGAHSCNEEGAAQPLQIVCGAQNFAAGNKVAVALIGAVLPGGLTIKKSKLRGVVSCGMNCSARELGLGADHEGILILPEDAPVGMPLAEYLGLSDTILDLEITPNRPDCMSMLGVAREVAAVYDTTYELGRAFAAPPQAGPVEELVCVSIDSPQRCPRYTARVIQGVTVGPSPAWLAERVTAAGSRSINNIVDASNYLMYELGQPLHAFDLDTFAKDEQGRAHIVVRGAKSGERFTTLDEVERSLTPDITCIVDGNAAGGAGATIALAGVMGGLNSEVTAGTVNLLLESAAFDGGHTSRTSRTLKLFSEAAGRYERGVDAATCDEFSKRAAALMVEVAGGTVAQGVVDVYPLERPVPELTLRLDRMRSFIGAEIATAEASAVLARLGCSITQAQGDTLLVRPPSYRPDLEREIDLYEEILRIWGMERVAPTLPGGRGRVGTRTREQRVLELVGSTLRAQGLNETMTYAFGAHDDLSRLGLTLNEGLECVELINPMSVEQSMLRASIIPGLLRSVAYNLSRGVANVQLYELGTVFTTAEGREQPKERKKIASVLTGSWAPAGWNTRAHPLDFFDAKGIIENLARELAIEKLRFVAATPQDTPWLQPGQAALVKAGSLELGWLGTIHPLKAQNFKLEAAVVAFELDVGALLAATRPKREYVEVPVYPAVELDVALVVDEAVTAEKLLQVLRQAGGSLLAEVRLFDVFTSAEKLGAGKKSLALNLSYRAVDRTLTFEEVEKQHAKLIRKVEAATGATVRA